MQPTVILGFDMETDVGSWTPFYEGLLHGTGRILDVLAAEEISATFYFTGDAAQQHPHIVRQVAEANHEVGCHSLYHETVGDELFEIPGVKPLLPEECPRRIELATEWVEQALGSKVVSFRAPRLWGSTALVNALEGLGYLTDATYPLYYYQKQMAPYHPAADDWTETGSLRLLEIPNFADMTITSNDQYGRDRDQWPLFRTEGADALMVHVDNMLQFYQEQNVPPVFCFYLHPWEFHPMPQGAIHFGEGAVIPDPFIVKNCGDVAVAELTKLITALKQRGARAVQAQDMVAIEANGYE